MQRRGGFDGGALRFDCVGHGQCAVGWAGTELGSSLAALCIFFSLWVVHVITGQQNLDPIDPRRFGCWIAKVGVQCRDATGTGICNAGATVFLAQN